MGVKAYSVQQALQRVADNPVPEDDDWLAKPAHELICRTLFELANTVSHDKQQQARANVARTLIFDRMIGRRKPGSHPATKTTRQVTFRDLTGGTT